METENPEGLESNPPDHLTKERHEPCQRCYLWFPEKFIEFEDGSFSCPQCRKNKRAKIERDHNDKLKNDAY